MFSPTEEQTVELQGLCNRCGVKRLDLFGSAATGDATGGSDLDFLVEFQQSAFDTYADAYFGLLEGLARLFHCPVDLVVASAIKNPYFLESVERTRTPVYEA